MPSGVLASPSEEALTRAAWQRVIFGEPLRRSHLLALSADFSLVRLQIRVTRNQPFEFIAADIKPFLSYAGYSAQFVYSAYDDSLSLAPTVYADIEFDWLVY